jgi:hypothetical protein
LFFWPCNTPCNSTSRVGGPWKYIPGHSHTYRKWQFHFSISNPVCGFYSRGSLILCRASSVREAEKLFQQALSICLILFTTNKVFSATVTVTVATRLRLHLSTKHHIRQRRAVSKKRAMIII